MLITRLVEMLDMGGYSCVIANGDDVRQFSLRGIADLYRLSHEEPEFLRGAIVADKIVGKGAAALMASCGVAQLYSHTISKGALELLNSTDMKVSYGECVDHIINRSRSGWCPVESLCKGVDSPEEIIPLLDRFMNELKNV